MGRLYCVDPDSTTLDFAGPEAAILNFKPSGDWVHELLSLGVPMEAPEGQRSRFIGILELYSALLSARFLVGEIFLPDGRGGFIRPGFFSFDDPIFNSVHSGAIPKDTVIRVSASVDDPMFTSPGNGKIKSNDYRESLRPVRFGKRVLKTWRGASLPSHGAIVFAASILEACLYKMGDEFRHGWNDGPLRVRMNRLKILTSVFDEVFKERYACSFPWSVEELRTELRNDQKRSAESRMGLWQDAKGICQRGVSDEHFSAVIDYGQFARHSSLYMCIFPALPRLQPFLAPSSLLNPSFESSPILPTPTL